MRHVGFITSDLLLELGSVSDVMTFFNCFKTYVEQPNSDKDWGLVTDKLYRRYLRANDALIASEHMAEGRQIMATIPSSFVDWKTMGWREDETELEEIKKPMLADVFERYYRGFDRCLEAITFNINKYGESEPIRVGITDTPFWVDEISRRLEEYDSLNGLPFWAR